MQELVFQHHAVRDVAKVNQEARDVRVAEQVSCGALQPEHPAVPGDDAAAHVGDRDGSFPLARIAQFRAAQPSIPFFIYEGAQHGFHNDTTPRYDEAAAKLAWQRSLEFFNKNVRG